MSKEKLKKELINQLTQEESLYLSKYYPEGAKSISQKTEVFLDNKHSLSIIQEQEIPKDNGKKNIIFKKMKKLDICICICVLIMTGYFVISHINLNSQLDFIQSEINTLKIKTKELQIKSLEIEKYSKAYI